MSFDQELEGNDSTSEVIDGSQEQAQPVTQPAGRTYTDSDMANARRSFEADMARREAKIRAEYAQPTKPATSPDHWSAFDPTVAQQLKAALQAEFDSRFTPIKQQQDDLAFRNEESAVKTKYKDYEANRLEILEFAVQNGIPRVEVAYHAWRSQNKWQDPEVIGKKYLADYQKKKATQSAETPLAEGRGGGSPSTKTNFRGKDGKLDKDAMDAAALEILHSAE